MQILGYGIGFFIGIIPQAFFVSLISDLSFIESYQRIGIFEAGCIALYIAFFIVAWLVGKISSYSINASKVNKTSSHSTPINVQKENPIGSLDKVQSLNTTISKPRHRSVEEHEKSKSEKLGQKEYLKRESLYKKLFAFRRSFANKHGVSPKSLMSNEIIKSIAAYRPETIEELKQIKGIGPRKVERFGKEVVDLVFKHCLKRKGLEYSKDYVEIKYLGGTRPGAVKSLMIVSSDEEYFFAKAMGEDVIKTYLWDKVVNEEQALAKFCA